MSAGGWSPTLRASGDSLVLVEFGERLTPQVHDAVIVLAEAVRAARLSGVRDVVPAYVCVGLHIDPLRVDLSAVARVVRRVCAELSVTRPSRPATVRWEIPVCYGGAHGPDLDEVAAFAECSASEVVRRHSRRSYQVYMLGFLPGFAYLGTVDPTIAMPRRLAPRAAVAAGSVGIAGHQTGVYPSVSPGGWRLIGQTPWRMFDLARPAPALLGAGDIVRFVSVSAGGWDAVGTGPSRS